MTAPVLVGVVGGGLVAQAVHLPNLSQMPDRFQLVSLADPSARVRDALEARYRLASTHADWRGLLEAERIDAVVVCSPHATHAAVVLAALDLSLHVFVEKPLCITPDDAERIAERAAEQECVVQVGYMKRYSRAYTSFLERLPETAEGLRLVDVTTYDPWMSREPFVPWSEMARGDDVPRSLIEEAAAAEQQQVADAVGREDPESVQSYSYTFLACLVHDVNLVHGALDRIGLSEGVEPRSSAAWANGEAACATLELPGGAAWRMCWLLLPGLMQFEENVRLYFDRAIHEVSFPAPYLRDATIEHRIIGASDDADESGCRSFVENPFVAELEHFHACITEGAPCRTPAHQAWRDLVLLRDLFLARTESLA